MATNKNVKDMIKNELEKANLVKEIFETLEEASIFIKQIKEDETKKEVIDTKILSYTSRIKHYQQYYSICMAIATKLRELLDDEEQQ